MSLRSRVVYIYSWPEMETILVDGKARTIGQCLVQEPVLYNGCLSLDVMLANVDSINYTCVNYLNLEDDSNKIDTLSLFNR